jgi:hypothetical protein
MENGSIPHAVIQDAVIWGIIDSAFMPSRAIRVARRFQALNARLNTLTPQSPSLSQVQDQVNKFYIALKHFDGASLERLKPDQSPLRQALSSAITVSGLDIGAERTMIASTWSQAHEEQALGAIPSKFRHVVQGYLHEVTNNAPVPQWHPFEPHLGRATFPTLPPTNMEVSQPLGWDLLDAQAPGPAYEHDVPNGGHVSRRTRQRIIADIVRGIIDLQQQGTATNAPTTSGAAAGAQSSAQPTPDVAPPQDQQAQQARAAINTHVASTEPPPPPLPLLYSTLLGGDMPAEQDSPPSHRVNASLFKAIAALSPTTSHNPQIAITPGALHKCAPPLTEQGTDAQATATADAGPTSASISLNHQGTMVFPPCRIPGDYIRKAARAIPRHRAPGPDGVRPDHIRTACTPNSDALNQLVEFTKLYAAGNMRGHAQMLSASRLIALDKNPGVRPIAVGNSLQRFVHGVLARYHAPAVRAQLVPHQLAVQAQDGTQALARMADQAVKQGNHLIVVDVKNAYNSVNRTAIFRSCARFCPDLLGAVVTAYEQESSLFWQQPDAASLGQPITSSRGTRQGDPLSTLLFAMALQPALMAVEKEFGDSVKVRAFADDIVLWANDIGVLARAYALLRDQLRHIGLEPRLSKSELLPAEWRAVAVSQIPDLLQGIRVAEQGAVITGCPIGTHAFIRDHAMALVRAIEPGARSILALGAQSAFLLLRCCIVPKITHLLRFCALHDIRAAMQCHDDLVQELCAAIVGVTPTLLSQPYDLTSPITPQDQLQLALRAGGCSLPSAFLTYPFAQIGAHSATAILLAERAPELGFRPALTPPTVHASIRALGSVKFAAHDVDYPVSGSPEAGSLIHPHLVQGARTLQHGLFASYASHARAVMQRANLRALQDIDRRIAHRTGSMLPDVLRELQTRRNELAAHVGRIHTLALTNASALIATMPVSDTLSLSTNDFTLAVALRLGLSASHADLRARVSCGACNQDVAALTHFTYCHRISKCERHTRALDRLHSTLARLHRYGAKATREPSDVDTAVRPDVRVVRPGIRQAAARWTTAYVDLSIVSSLPKTYADIAASGVYLLPPHDHELRRKALQKHAHYAPHIDPANGTRDIAFIFNTSGGAYCEAKDFLAELTSDTEAHAEARNDGFRPSGFTKRALVETALASLRGQATTIRYAQQNHGFNINLTSRAAHRIHVARPPQPGPETTHAHPHPPPPLPTQTHHPPQQPGLQATHQPPTAPQAQAQAPSPPRSPSGDSTTSAPSVALVSPQEHHAEEIAAYAPGDTLGGAGGQVVGGTDEDLFHSVANDSQGPGPAQAMQLHGQGQDQGAAAGVSPTPPHGARYDARNDASFRPRRVALRLARRGAARATSLGGPARAAVSIDSLYSLEAPDSFLPHHLALLVDHGPRVGGDTVPAPELALPPRPPRPHIRSRHEAYMRFMQLSALFSDVAPDHPLQERQVRALDFLAACADHYCSMAATTSDMQIARAASHTAVQVADAIVRSAFARRNSAPPPRWTNRYLAMLHAVARARTRNLLSTCALRHRRAILSNPLLHSTSLTIMWRSTPRGASAQVQGV